MTVTQSWGIWRLQEITEALLYVLISLHWAPGLYLEMCTNWSSLYVQDFILTFGCIVLMVIWIGHIDQTIHGWVQSSVDLMKKGKELHRISQQTQKDYMLPTETERNYSWKQLTR